MLVAASLASVVACSSGGGSERVALPITDLPTMCEGFGNVPSEGQAQLTFVKGTLAYGVAPDGRGLHCITAVAGTNPIAWSPQADFVVDLGFAASEVISASGRVAISGPGKSARFQGLSRPSGAYALSAARDGSSLAKVPTDGGKLVDISFLRRHDEAAYHPAGTQLAVLGETHDEIYGMWLVDDDGKGSHLIVPSRDEDEFYGMSFSSFGAKLYYVDDQHTFFELRELDLATLEEGIALPKSKLLVDDEEPIIAAASPFTENLLTYRVGSCDAGFTTFVREGSTTTEVGGDLGDTQPIGWLPDDRLALASTDDLCDPQRELDLHVVEDERARLIVEDVSQAAVRTVLPEGDEPVSGPVGSASE
jgi:hypothetical protein